MTKLGEWLKGLPGMKAVHTGKLTLGDLVFEAAYYQQECEAPAGCQNPGPYIREAIYAVGEIPKILLKKKHAFTMPDDTAEWFVSTYMLPKNFKPENKECHPFGLTFIISPWTCAEKIDAHERKPYIRLPIKFERDNKEDEVIAYCEAMSKKKIPIKMAEMRAIRKGDQGLAATNGMPFWTDDWEYVRLMGQEDCEKLIKDFPDLFDGCVIHGGK